MAIIDAILLPDSVHTDWLGDFYRPKLPDFRPSGGSVIVGGDAAEVGGDVVDATPLQFPSFAIDAMAMPSAESDWYNRIHVIPPSISAGAIPAEKVEPFTVWNAFLNRNSIYEIIKSSDTDGVTVQGDTLTEFERLELREFQLFFASTGDPAINTLITFDFIDGSGDTLVTGVRISFLPVWPQVPMMESLNPITWVFKAKDGTEQRSRSRGRPKRTLRHDLLMSQEQWRPINNILSAQTGRRWAAVMAGEVQKINTSFAVNDTTVDIQTDYSEYFVDGGLVVIYKNYEEWHLSTIASIDSNSLELDTPIAAAMTGEMLVAPVFVGRGNGNPTYSTDPVGNHKLGMTYEIYEGDQLGGQVEDTYFGDYAYIGRPNEGKTVGGGFTNDQFIHGSRFGLATWGTNWSVSKPKKSVTWTLQSQAELWWFRGFFYEHQGNIPFWMPSQEEDMKLSSPLAGGTLVLTVKNDYYKDNGELLRKAVRIVYADGTADDLRNIVTVTSGAGDTTVIELDFATDNTGTLPVDDVRIEFVHLLRLEKATISHYGYKAIAKFSATEITQ